MHLKLNKLLNKLNLFILSSLTCVCTQATTWSSTTVSLKYGESFSEPYKNNADGSQVDISKTYLSLTNTIGYKYGVNYIKADFIQSSDEPNANAANGKGAFESYLVYRHTLDIGKILDKDLSYQGFIKGYGLVLGGDWNTKNDVYSSRKHLYVIGPTIMFDVKGMLNFSMLAVYESNKPNSVDSRYKYDPRLSLQLAWVLPIMDTSFSFEGLAMFHDSKGLNESGKQTVQEYNIDAMLMYDVSKLLNLEQKKIRIGIEYQYWKNKFGNSDKGNDGATSKSPMIRAEYKF